MTSMMRTSYRISTTTTRRGPETLAKLCQREYCDSDRNRSKVKATRTYTQGMTSESAFSFPCIQPLLLLSTCCGGSVCSVFMEHQQWVCFSLLTQFVCYSYSTNSTPCVSAPTAHLTQTHCTIAVWNIVYQLLDVCAEMHLPSFISVVSMCSANYVMCYRVSTWESAARLT